MIAQLNLQQNPSVQWLLEMVLELALKMEQTAWMRVQGVKAFLRRYALVEMWVTTSLPYCSWNGYGDPTWLTVDGTDGDSIESEESLERKGLRR